MKERGERWLAQIQAEYQALSPDEYRAALAVEFDWYHAICDHEEGEDDKLSSLMRDRAPIPTIAREHLLHRLIHGRPKKPAKRPRKVTPFEAMHLVLYCKIVQGLGFSNKDGAGSNESFTAAAVALGITPDYVRKLYNAVPKEQRDRHAEGLQTNRPDSGKK